MNIVSAFALLPLLAVLAGTLAGFLVGRYLGQRPFLWLLGLVSLISLVVVIRLTMVGPGEEEAAFAPLAVLVGGLFPLLFGVIMGGVGGRAMARRDEAR